MGISSLLFGGNVCIYQMHDLIKHQNDAKRFLMHGYMYFSTCRCLYLIVVVEISDRSSNIKDKSHCILINKLSERDSYFYSHAYNML
jgi:hypothetical protein